MFQHRLQSFFSQYLLNDAHPLGQITDYVIKIEIKMRGSPQVHCLLWVKDAPKSNQDSDDDVYRFIDKYITAVLPKGVLESESDANLIVFKNIHIQTTVVETISCQPSEEDKADDIIKYAKDVLQKVQNVLSYLEITNDDLAIADLL